MSGSGSLPISRCRRVRAELPVSSLGILSHHLEAAMSQVRTVCLIFVLAVVAGCDAPEPITAPSPQLQPRALTGTPVVVQNTNDAVMHTGSVNPRGAAAGEARRHRRSRSARAPRHPARAAPHESVP